MSPKRASSFVENVESSAKSKKSWEQDGINSCRTGSLGTAFDHRFYKWGVDEGRFDDDVAT